MADRALADELRIAAGIALVDPDRSGRQCVAQTLVARAGEAKHAVGADRLVLSAEPGVAIFISANGRASRDVEETHLLLLAVGDRRPFGKRVKIEVAEPLAIGRLGPGLADRPTWRRRRRIRAAVARLVLTDGSRDQQGIGVAIFGAAIVGQSNPPLNVHPAVRLVEQGDIIGLPAEPGSQIGQGDGTRSRLSAFQRHRQGRTGTQILGNAIEDHSNRQPVVAKHLYPIADLEDDPAIGGKHPRAFPDLGAGRRIGSNKGDRLAHRLLDQGLRRKQVEIEILLDDADAVAGQAHRLRSNLGGDVGEFLARAAVRNVQLPAVLNQCQIVVVDRDRHIALRALRRRRDLVLSKRRYGKHQRQPEIMTHKQAPAGQGTEHVTLSHGCQAAQKSIWARAPMTSTL